MIVFLTVFNILTAGLTGFLFYKMEFKITSILSIIILLTYTAWWYGSLIEFGFFPDSVVPYIERIVAMTVSGLVTTVSIVAESVWMAKKELKNAQV